jgi:hypothetical protein
MIHSDPCRSVVWCQRIHLRIRLFPTWKVEASIKWALSPSGGESNECTTSVADSRDRGLNRGFDNACAVRRIVVPDGTFILREHRWDVDDPLCQLLRWLPH